MFRNTCLHFFSSGDFLIDLYRAQFLTLKIDMRHLSEENSAALFLEDVLLVLGLGVGGTFKHERVRDIPVARRLSLCPHLLLCQLLLIDEFVVSVGVFIPGLVGGLIRLI